MSEISGGTHTPVLGDLLELVDERRAIDEELRDLMEESIIAQNSDVTHGHAMAADKLKEFAEFELNERECDENADIDALHGCFESFYWQLFAEYRNEIQVTVIDGDIRVSPGPPANINRAVETFQNCLDSACK